MAMSVDLATVETAFENIRTDAENGSRLYQDPPGTVTLRNGDVVANLRRRLEQVAYQVPVTFASGLTPDDGSYTVENAGKVYAAKPSALPFTTTATFDSSQWLLLSGLDFQARNAVNASEGALLPEGSIFEMGGRKYRKNSDVSLADSATSDLGVASLEPAFDAHYEHYGADGTGVTDSTAHLRRMVTWAMENKRWHDWGDGTEFLVSGRLWTNFVTNSADFKMRGGSVSITVDSSATTFDYLFYMESTAGANAIIDVAFLDVNGQERAASCFWLRHHGSWEGVAANRGLLYIRNFKQNDASATAENGGLSFTGYFKQVDFGMGVCHNIGRVAGANMAGAATFGIAASGFEEIHPVSGWAFDDINCGSTSNVDADGIKLFGRNPGTTYNAREGFAVVQNCRFKNCMGRGVKFQVQGAVENCEFELNNKGVIAQANHIDFQIGAGRVTNCRFRHYGSVTNPFTTGTSFSMVVFQCSTDNLELSHRLNNCELVCDVKCPRAVAVIPKSYQRDCSVDIDGLRVLPVEGFTTKAFDRGVVEVAVNEILAAAPNKIDITVSNVVGPIGVSAIVYTGYSSGSVANLFFQASDNIDLLRANRRVIDTISGSQIADMTRLRIQRNDGFSHLYGNVTFDIDGLPCNTEFGVVYNSGTITDAPATWNAASQTWNYAIIRSYSEYLGDGYAQIDFEIHDSNTIPILFKKYSNGSNWTEYRAIEQQTGYENISDPPSASDFNSLLTRLRGAGVIAI